MAEEIALEIDEDVENVQITINYLMSKNLLVTSSEYEGFLSDVPNLIGSESGQCETCTETPSNQESWRKRKLQCNAETLQRNTEVTNGNTEIDIEIEKEIDIEQEPEKEVKPSGDDVYLFYQKNFKTESEFIKQDLENWVNVLSVEVVTLELQKLLRKCTIQLCRRHHEELGQ